MYGVLQFEVRFHIKINIVLFHSVGFDKLQTRCINVTYFSRS